MSSSDAPEESTATPPRSLKAIAQQLLLDTLEPDQRLEVAAQALSQISLSDHTISDLTSFPLAVFQQGVEAHAAIPINQALLVFLPELAGRLKAIGHHSHSIESDKQMSHHSTKTSYLVKTKAGHSRTLVIKTAHGHFDTCYDGERWANADFEYTGGPITAQFSVDASPSASNSFTSLSCWNLGELLKTLAKDLQLPIISSAASVAEETRRASIQEETRSRLCREADAAKAAHRSVSSTGSHRSCEYRCKACEQTDKDLKVALGRLERPSIAYPLPKLWTPSAKQRDLTFGRLIRALLPREFREEWMDDIWELDFLGKGEDDVENMLRQAAVAGRDVEETHEN